MGKNNYKLSDLFLKSGEKKPMKWLFPVEIAMVIYAIFTLFVILFTSTSLSNPEALIWWRVRVVLLTVALWLVYRVWPCRVMALARIGLLLVTLSWWYPDTYVLNCHFENLDHVFANWDQKLFGFQPALLWNKAYPSHIVSELMAMGYSLYFLMFVSLTFYVFFKRYEDFQKVSFILITSFFVYYVVFVLFPVAGPQYYYLAVGVDEIAREKLHAVGLEDRVFDLYPAEISGGMQKRAALARAISLEPEVLVFDEPTSGLDPITGGVICNLLKDTVQSLGVTAITITHDLRVAEFLADRVSLLNKGVMVWTGHADDMRGCGNEFVENFYKASNVILRK